jgi:hypothetical protein
MNLGNLLPITFCHLLQRPIFSGAPLCRSSLFHPDLHMSFSLGVFTISFITLASSKFRSLPRKVRG